MPCDILIKPVRQTPDRLFTFARELTEFDSAVSDKVLRLGDDRLLLLLPLHVLAYGGAETSQKLGLGFSSQVLTFAE